MVLIDRNQDGRVFVRDAQIKRSVHNFITSFYPNVCCYCVGYEDSTITLYIKNTASINVDLVTKLQFEIRELFENKMGIFIKDVAVRYR